ncbi:carbohydrate ABC transporter permease [Streptomyces bottropensis]|uniref:carbohydrate ABC transporter permease n=1 Tax=Streptomyces bottropensis TaxID=42235 RepID=UPI0036C7DB59
MRNLLGRGTARAALVLWTLLAVVPFVLILLLSVRSNADIYLNGLGITGKILPGNYARAWQGSTGTAGLTSYFSNSLIAAVTALVFNLGAGVTAAYFATHLSDRSRIWFTRLFVSSTVLPIVLMIVPYYQAFNAFGVLNMPVVIGIAYGALALPTTVLIMHSFFVDFPVELLEAAALDGTGAWRTYVRIVLPLAKGAVTAVAMLTLVFVWGETQLGVVLLQSGESQTVPVGLLSFQGQYTTDQGALFAGLSLASIPIILLYLVFHKNVTKGIALGGVFK